MSLTANVQSGTASPRVTPPPPTPKPTTLLVIYYYFVSLLQTVLEALHMCVFLVELSFLVCVSSIFMGRVRWKIMSWV